MLLGLRTAIYPVGDLAAGRDWYSKALGHAPYFDQSFYVGFEVGGFWSGVFGALLYSVISWLLISLLTPRQ